MANAQEMKPVWGGAMLETAQDAPSAMETRPTPNDEQHRTFQLTCRHREANDRYAAYIAQLEDFADALAFVLDLPVEKRAEGKR